MKLRESKRSLMMRGTPRCSRLHGSIPDSPPTTSADLTSALYDSGTLRQGAVVSVTIAEQIKTEISNLWFLDVVYSEEASPRPPDRLLLKWALKESAAPERGDP